jgi:hypothetical protein
MPTGSITGLVLYDSKLFNRNSHVGRWAHSVSRNLNTNTFVRAPVNKRANKSHLDSAYPPGSLKANIETFADRIGPKHWQIGLNINVPYADYVIRGTQGPIVANTADYMTLPRNLGYRKRRHFTVAGQRPNNFLAEAAAATARQHPSLRGLEDMLYQQW